MFTWSMTNIETSKQNIESSKQNIESSKQNVLSASAKQFFCKQIFFLPKLIGKWFFYSLEILENKFSTKKNESLSQISNPYICATQCHRH